MKRWQPTTNRANAIRSRRRLSFEVCECRLALDGAGVAWIDLFASGSLTQANSGGLTYVFQNTTPQNAAQVPSSDLAVLADPDAEFLHADYADTDAPGIDVDDSVDGGFPRGGEPSVTTRYFLSLDQAYSSRGLAFPATDQAPGVPQLTRMFPARPIVRLQDPFDADPAAAAASSLEVATISIAGLFAGVPGVAVAEIPPSAAEQRGPVALRAVDDALPASEVLVVERPHSIVDAGRRQSCGVARAWAFDVAAVEDAATGQRLGEGEGPAAPRADTRANTRPEPREESISQTPRAGDLLAGPFGEPTVNERPAVDRARIANEVKHASARDDAFADLDAAAAASPYWQHAFDNRAGLAAFVSVLLVADRVSPLPACLEPSARSKPRVAVQKPATGRPA